MSDHTTIEWTDATWNIITGCSVLSKGCTNCYAMRMAGSRLKHHPSRAGLTQPSAAGAVWNGQVRFNAQWLDQPLTWRKPRRIFVCAHGDLFHESVPDEWIDQVFAVMAAAPWHTFQVLTKRAERMRRYLTRQDRAELIEYAAVRLAIDDLVPIDLNGGPHTLPLPNVWLGVSAEDQATANERIPHLLASPGAVHWISAEPLLGHLDLQRACQYPALLYPELDPSNVIDWVVTGGESGPGARPAHPDWFRSLRDQCSTMGVPLHFKQWGAWGDPDSIEATGIAHHGWFETDRKDGGIPRHEWPGPIVNGVELASQRPEVFNVGKKAAGRLLDGRTHDEWPSR